MNYLSRTLQNMALLLDYRFHPQCKDLKLTHSVFTNDLVTFWEEIVISFSRIMKDLQYFLEVT